MDVTGKSAIVTGGASGLGLATATMLARAGAKVTVFDLSEQVVPSLETYAVRFANVDVCDEQAINQALDDAEAIHGIARILVNCAGVCPAVKTIGRDMQPHPIAAFRTAVEVNLLGTFVTLSRFAARLVAAEPIGEERGIIINTSSVAAFDGQIGQAAYAASKSGVAGMTLPLARDLAEHLIRVVTVAPGIFWTPLLAGLPQAAQASLAKQVPHPSRLGKPDEYAQLVQAIIENPMLNGETIRLDGAIRMSPR